VYEALVQEAEVHEAEVHEADVHDADVQEADVQLASVLAAVFHASASRYGLPLASEWTKVRSAAFGLGGAVCAAAAAASISPIPTDIEDAFGTNRAVFISAPLTWSGDQSGWRARIWAAAPATTGAANEVPDIHA
jgi:hypothetical protein